MLDPAEHSRSHLGLQVSAGEHEVTSCLCKGGLLYPDGHLGQNGPTMAPYP